MEMWKKSLERPKLELDSGNGSVTRKKNGARGGKIDFACKTVF